MYKEEDGVDCGEVGEIGRIVCEEVVQRLDSERGLHLGFVRSSSSRGKSVGHTFLDLLARCAIPLASIVTSNTLISIC